MWLFWLLYAVTLAISNICIFSYQHVWRRKPGPMLLVAHVFLRMKPFPHLFVCRRAEIHENFCILGMPELKIGSFVWATLTLSTLQPSACNSERGSLAFSPSPGPFRFPSACREKGFLPFPYTYCLALAWAHVLMPGSGERIWPHNVCIVFALQVKSAL